MSTAEVLNSMPSAQTILRETFGYQQFRPGQQEIIHTITTGRDCLVVMPTGVENPLLSNPRIIVRWINRCCVASDLLNERSSRSALSSWH